MVSRWEDCTSFGSSPFDKAGIYKSNIYYWYLLNIYIKTNIEINFEIQLIQIKRYKLHHSFRAVSSAT